MDARFYVDMACVALVVIVPGLALGEAIAQWMERRDGTGCP